MTNTRTDFVIQISTPASKEDVSAEGLIPPATPVLAELHKCLKPGAEIGVVFRGYFAVTSVLWLSEPQADGSVRAGVKLVGVSARPSNLVEMDTLADQHPVAPL